MSVVSPVVVMVVVFWATAGLRIIPQINSEDLQSATFPLDRVPGGVLREVLQEKRSGVRGLLVPV